MNTIGTRFQVRRAVLEDEANIEEAFEFFYLGADSDNGLEYYLSDHEDRIVDIEAAVAGVGVTVFDDQDFRIYKHGAASAKAKFNLSSFTTERTITLLDVDQTLVNTSSAQTLTNKTLAPASSVVGVKDNSLTIYDSSLSGKNLRFSNTNLPTATTVASFPNLAGDDTLVFADVAQVVKNKTFGGYSESVTTSSTVDVNQYNAAVLTVASSVTVAFTGTLPVGAKTYSCSFLFLGSANITWPAGIKWAGGTSLASVSSVAMAVLFYYNGNWYGVNMGTFS